MVGYYRQVGNRRQLTLPEGPRRILDGIHPFVLDVLPADQILLGGGTALASHWQHRESFDIDLFVDPVTFNRDICGRRAECEDRLIELGLGRTVAFDEDACGVFPEDGMVDIVGCFALTTESRSEDRVAGTSTALETNAEILAKKLHRRILAQGRIVPRDLYDFAFARRFEARSWEAAWTARRVADPHVMIAALSSFRPGWMDRQKDAVRGAR